MRRWGRRPEEHGADAGRGSHRGGVPAEDAAAAGRRAGLPAGHHPQPQPQRPAPLPPAPRHLPAARSRRRAPSASACQDHEIGYVHIDSCELRSRRRQAGHVPGHRSGLEVHLRRVLRRHRQDGRLQPSCENVVEPSSPTRSTPCSPTTAWPSPTCPRTGTATELAALLGRHIFDRVCIDNGIEHRLTKPYHPWTNGQAERMNRTVKDATVKVFHYDDLESLKAHVLAFVTAYNFAKHLKALRWRTPFQAICEAWTRGPVNLQDQPAPPHPGPHTCGFDLCLSPTRSLDVEGLQTAQHRGTRSGQSWQGVDSMWKDVGNCKCLTATLHGGYSGGAFRR